MRALRPVRLTAVMIILRDLGLVALISYFLQDFVVIVVFSVMAAGPANSLSNDVPDNAASIRESTPIAASCRVVERDVGRMPLGAGPALPSKTPTGT